MRRNQSPGWLSSDDLARLEQLEELLDWIKQTLHGTPVPQEPANALILMTVGSAYRRAQAAVCEVRGGSAEGLRILARSVIESMITLAYIIGDQSKEMDRVVGFLAESTRQQRAMAQADLEVLKKKGTKASKSAAQPARSAIQARTQDLDKLAARFGQDAVKFPNLEQRARGADVLELYATGYRLFSQEVHASLLSLERYVDRASANEVLDLEAGEQIAGSIIGALYVYIVGMVSTCNERLDLKLDDEIEPFSQIAQQIMEEDA